MRTPANRAVLVPRLLKVGSGASQLLPAMLSEGEFDLDNVLVVSGTGPSSSYGRQIRDLLADGGVATDEQHCEAGTIEQAAALASHIINLDVTLLVAVGGGRVLDTVKLASNRTGTALVAVPTTIAHDGISSPVASLTDRHGVRRSLAASMPTGVVVDTDIIAKAPLRNLRAGLGDLVSNLVALQDWRLADKLNQDSYDEFSALIAEGAARPALDLADLEAPESIDILAKGLVLSGLAMATAGTSRPCSGAEHLISHALDAMLGSGAALHGEQVALGSLVAAAAHGALLPELRTVFANCGVPDHPSKVGLSLDDLASAVSLAPQMRPSRFTVLSERSLERVALMNLLSAAFE